MAALVIALTTIGGEGRADRPSSCPSTSPRAFQGLLLALVLGADALSRYRVRFVPGTADVTGVRPLSGPARAHDPSPRSVARDDPQGGWTDGASKEVCTMTLDVLQMVLVTIVAAATPADDRGTRRTRGRAVRRAQSRRRGHDGARRRHGLRGGRGNGLDIGRSGGGGGRRPRSVGPVRNPHRGARRQPDRLRARHDDPRPRPLRLGRRLLCRHEAGIGAASRDSRPQPTFPASAGCFFGQDAFVYAGFALVAGIAWFLWRTRAGLALRAIGDDHTSTHCARPQGAQGPVPRGAVRRRLRRSRRSLSLPRLHARSGLRP